MKIIKEDDFLRDAFIKFAEPLYEQFNDKKAKWPTVIVQNW